MVEPLPELSPRLREHIEAIARRSGLPFNEDSLQRMARAWEEKRQMFERQAHALALRGVDSFPADSPGGALVLTYSGSLISIEPPAAGMRRVEYASIPLRADVPATAVAEHARLDHALTVDGEAAFMDGPVKTTSRLFRIAVCDPDVPAREQRERIREATIFLTNGFMKINRTVVPPAAGAPEQFTQRSIVAYLARRHNLTQKQTLELLKDYHSMVESGLLLGARVPFGRIGSLFLRRRPARQARVGLNPATGERLTISAQPERMVARMSFAAALKRKLRSPEIP